MFGSRMMAFGVVAMLGIVFFFAGLSLTKPLRGFLTPSQVVISNGYGVTVDMTEPGESMPYFAFIGAAIGMGALAWLRFSLRGPYLKVMVILFGTAAVAGLLTAVYYHYQIKAAFEASFSLYRQATDGGLQLVFDSSLATQATIRVALVAGGAALLLGIVVGLFRKGDKTSRFVSD